MTVSDAPPIPRPARAPRDTLRIAVVAPPWFELPPRGYGGIESVVADLVDSLAERGHEVTLVGSGHHRTRAARFVRVFDEPPSERLGTPAPEVIHAAAAGAALADLDVDVVHDHSLAGPLLARGRRVPTVVTMHGPVDGEQGEYFAALGDSVDVVAISDAQRRLNPGINWVGRVHNAIDVSSFPFRADKDDHVLWLGRFSPDKGPHLAIDAARAAGLRIVLAGKRSEPAEREFFEREVRPRLGRDAEYVGEADAALKRELLASARALAFPIQWEEPFGMVMIEAMACGTPVVALPRGSVPEVVDHGRSGLVVRDPADFPAALSLAADLDPAACRRHAERNFDLPVMAAGYERLFRSIVEGQRSVRALTAPRASLRRLRERGVSA
ncbi:glycosyltransferase family 4 protein [Paenibacillus sp. TRM 82003]|uniref:glycosyltransferase family 4 protein n=1 Tax=Kineococcus sp. TRM81007 TaxID=2925831 RepID=UPI001F578467|nr:glycosyltransferase family 4 protein [Kineococcus sp. TRM81007]MCI2238875.1 glycosyltransferase family 4 protein [Kineococcus sp. TRM81007]MCI3924280.1 glycosyltransferase family 4 protein [Paenibacillus sp. TRM 82003]